MNVRSDAVVCDDMSGLEEAAGLTLSVRHSPDWLKFKNPERLR